MIKNKTFQQDQIVKFTKKAKVYDLDNKTEFLVPKGTSARIILDEDVGEIGSCKIKLTKKDGKVIVAEADDKYLKIIK